MLACMTRGFIVGCLCVVNFNNSNFVFKGKPKFVVLVVVGGMWREYVREFSASPDLRLVDI